MSLYDGLDIGGDGGGSQSKADVSGWGSRMKLLESQKQLQAKKALLVQKKKPAATTTLAPVIDLKRRNDELPLHFNQQTGRLERMTAALIAAPFIATALDVPALVIGPDEYDPFRPNEYEDFVKKRKQQRQKEREEERKKENEERERRRKERQKNDDGEDVGELETMRRRHEEEEEEEEQRPAVDRTSRGGAAIAPPMSLIESDKTIDNNAAQRSANGKDMATPGYGALGSVASMIMARMGYKHGQGLGKAEQGMSTALQVEKTSKRGGKIIHEKDANSVIPAVVSSPKQTDTSNANMLSNPSKVILLLNMVGPGEVDGDLELETAEECQKYGKVAKCVIYEVPDGSEDEAVRIFLEFEKVESAIKAVIDLNGRYFGGRIVKASFYDVDRFHRLDLADAGD